MVFNRKSKISIEGGHAMNRGSRALIPQPARKGRLCPFLALSLLFLLTFRCLSVAAELPLVRIAQAAFNEKVLALLIGVEQGFFRKYGVNVEVINIALVPRP